MPKKGENITKRKDGRYEARYVKERDEYGRIKKYGFVYSKSYLEVKRKREEILKSIKKEKIIHEKTTFTDSINLWFNTKILLKDSSYTNYYSIINSKIIPFFKDSKISELNEEKIIEFINYLKMQNLSNKRIKDILLILKQFLYYKNINIKIELPKISHNKIINELCALQWKDIDLENKVIHISKTLIRVKNKDSDSINKTKIILDVPKTQNSIRDVPINESILPYLKKFKNNDDYYFLTNNNTFITTKKYYLFYLEFLKSLSIKKYKFHILRHTFATQSLLCGVDIKSLSEILGHSSVKTTLDLYVHVTDNEKLLQINKLTFPNLTKSK